MITAALPPLVGFEKPAIIRANDLPAPAILRMLQEAAPFLAMPFQPGFRSRARAFNCVYTDYVSTLATQSSYTFTNRAIGPNTTHPYRKAYVMVQSRHTADAHLPPTAVTVGGRAGVDVADLPNRLNLDTTYATSSIWEVDTTGLATPASVVVTFAGNHLRCSIAVYEVLDGVVLDADGANDGSTTAPHGETITLTTPTTPDVGAMLVLGIGYVNGSPAASGFTARQNSVLDLNLSAGRDYSIILGDDLAPASGSDTVAITIAADSRTSILGLSLRQAP
jgi:hypothetical protein